MRVTIEMVVTKTSVRTWDGSPVGCIEGWEIATGLLALPTHFYLVVQDYNPPDDEWRRCSSDKWLYQVRRRFPHEWTGGPHGYYVRAGLVLYYWIEWWEA